MGFFLAIDAGGASTECWLADERQVLAKVKGGTVKLVNVGGPEATERLGQMLSQAAHTAGVPLDSVTRTCMGLAGISSAGVRNWAEISLEEFVGGERILTGDAEIALEAAFGDSAGVLVIAGTGSQVVGRCSSGMRLNAGGWGPMLGDEGSGHWIGVEAIRSALRARDRGVPGTLLKEINSAWEVDSVSALIAKSNQRPRPDFASLAHVVSGCATKGDVLATSVLERAGEELAAQVGVVLAKMLAASCPPADTHRVAFTGGVLKNSAVVLASLAAALKRLPVDAELDTAPVEAIEGALARARRGS